MPRSTVPKTTVTLVLVCLAILGVLGGVLWAARGIGGLAAGSGLVGGETGQNVLSVVGTATVSAKPTLAQIVLGVQTRSPNISEALSQNSEISAKVASSLSRFGIGPSNLTTLWFSVYPVYGETGLLEYYEVDNTLEVNMSASNITLVGQVVEAAVQAGATQVEYVRFTLSPTQQAQLRSQALRLALVDAQQKAQQAASQLGLSVVGVKHVYIQDQYLPPIVYMPLETPAAQQPQLYPGQAQYTVSVEVEYILS